MPLVFELNGLLDRLVFSGQRRQVVAEPDPTGFGQQRAAFSNSLARLSHGCSFSLCAHRWDLCTKAERNVPWQGNNALHWTFEMTQHFRWKQALLLNIYQLSVRVLFSTSSTLQQPSAFCKERLRLCNIHMLFWLRYWHKKKGKAAFSCTFATQQHRGSNRCHTCHLNFTVPLTERVDSDVNNMLFSAIIVFNRYAFISSAPIPLCNFDSVQFMHFPAYVAASGATEPAGMWQKYFWGPTRYIQTHLYTHIYIWMYIYVYNGFLLGESLTA